MAVGLSGLVDISMGAKASVTVDSGVAVASLVAVAVAVAVGGGGGSVEGRGEGVGEAVGVTIAVGAGVAHAVNVSNTKMRKANLFMPASEMNIHIISGINPNQAEEENPREPNPSS